MAVLYQNVIAIYDDSFQPTGNTKFDPWPHVEMKKLRHELKLTIEGPESVSDAVQGCLREGAIAGLLAAVAASFAGAGLGATGPAMAAFQAQFVRCAGEQVQARVDDNSHWITWWT